MTGVCVCVCVCVCVFVCVCVCAVHACVYVCVYVYVYVCMYVCTYVCVYACASMTPECTATTANKRGAAAPIMTDKTAATPQPAAFSISEGGAIGGSDSAGGEGGAAAASVKEALVMPSGFGNAAVQRRTELEERRCEAATKRNELAKQIKNEGRKHQHVM